ncbi:MAG TPA: glycoside hydrolase family 3 C-terminal domain-containing protein [Burkholderiaceae bacterium]|jgi:beta-glucosidase
MPSALTNARRVAAIFVMTGAACAAQAATTPVYRDRSAPVEARVADALKQLTQDEKLALIGGDRDFYIRAIPRLGLPEIRMADGPIGVRNDTRSTAYPASVALAASWDVGLANDFGTALGRDGRARGVHIQLGPAVNIQRVPQNGRNFEYLSEDPFLAARFGVAIVKGMQSQGVVATVKHYAANNQETERMTIDARIGERALREIYLPAFEAAVKEGGAWAVMSAYNRLNGDYATANQWLNLQVLKKEWAFPGVLMSDWDATHDTLGAAAGGLDLEMPSGKSMNAKALKPFMDGGQITQENLDDKVRRILRLEVAMGFLDRPQQDRSIPLDDPRSSAVALKIAQEGTVLLKNEKALLPLQSGQIHKLVLIGPAGNVVAAGGGSSTVRAIHSTTLLAALKTQVAKVDFIDGTGLNPAERLIDTAHYEGPLKREIFDGMELQGPVRDTKQVKKIAEDWTGHAPAKGLTPNKFSARWTGKIVAPKTADYTFVVSSDDGSRVFVDDQLVVDFWSDHGLASKQGTLHMEAGTTHQLRVEYMQDGGDAVMRFGWGIAQPGPLLTTQQNDLIRAADAVVFAAGYSQEDESEGSDRSYELPHAQPALIKAVAEMNPRTIVVVNSGGRVETASWLGKVPALLQAWFPGQDGNRAVADILFGKLNPSGKLPFTYEKRLEDSAAFAHSPANYPGQVGHVDYAEGILVGYRWADSKQIEPLFPFGYGLSYTHFDYSAPEVKRDANGHQAVSFKLTNAGSVAGSEVAQVYVEPPPNSGVMRPVRELKGFARLELKPGETGQATVTLDDRAFAYFDEASHAWKTDPGRYTVVIGASSRDGRLRVPVDLTP